MKLAIDLVKAQRVKADEEARDAILKMEQELVSSLDGETLSGLPDLGDRVYGLRLVGEDQPACSRLPEGRTVLVLTAKGQLLAARIDGGSAFVQKAPFSMLNASQLAPFARAVERAVTLHVSRSAVRSDRFALIARVAADVRKSLSAA